MSLLSWSGNKMFWTKQASDNQPSLRPGIISHILSDWAHGWINLTLISLLGENDQKAHETWEKRFFIVVFFLLCFVCFVFCSAFVALTYTSSYCVKL